MATAKTEFILINQHGKGPISIDVQFPIQDPAIISLKQAPVKFPNIKYTEHESKKKGKKKESKKNVPGQSRHSKVSNFADVNLVTQTFNQLQVIDEKNGKLKQEIYTQIKVETFESPPKPENGKKISQKELLNVNQQSHFDQMKKTKSTDDFRKSELGKTSKMKHSATVAANLTQKQQPSQNIYEPYWPDEKIEQGLADKSLIKGRIRINQRNYEDAFVSDPDGGSDVYISGLKDRNRALNNDIVAIKLKEKYCWKILEPFKKQIEDRVQAFMTGSNVLTNPTTSAEANNTENANKNKMSEFNQDLIDLAPMCFSKPDLLESLDNTWFQRTAIVVGIIEKKNSRFAAGYLRLFGNANNNNNNPNGNRNRNGNKNNQDWALFSPKDSRLPRIKIKISECPPDFVTNAKHYENTIFAAKITDIPINSRYAIGELKKSLGVEGSIEVETEAILIENGIDFSDFEEKMKEFLPKTPWSIPDVEYKTRRDLRNMCIFTIDPATARDLDDALHCVKIDEDLYEVGVHIADVSYFVEEDSEIDKVAMERTTSVYLVQKVIPMLPRLLCEQLCSLNPNTDRLTFSVIWKMKSNGEILEEWFGRSIINSATKLSYDHAQAIIENPEKDFNLNEFPTIREGFGLDDIKRSTLNLHKIAKNLRAKRYENGCLALNQPKLSFVLNKENYMPYAYNIYQQKDSNRLVEEFMLLANIAVAHHIYTKFPNKAILRRHPNPNLKQLEQLGESIKANGFSSCSIQSSASIQSFLNAIQKDNTLAATTLTCLLTKTMQLAQYFCSGNQQNKEQFYHYGLAVPLYTHFTSPIRRYPDVLVHRLLAASLGYSEETRRVPAYLQSISETCNDKKYSARICSERSSELFFSLFVNECGPFEESACVIQIKDRSFDILLVNLGITKRVYLDKLNIVQESITYTKGENNSELSFKWSKNEKYPNDIQQTLKLFANVNVTLTKHESDKLKFNVILKHPEEKFKSRAENTARLDASLLLQEQLALIQQREDIDPYILD